MQKMELRKLDREQLQIGSPLPGHLRDRRGRILVSAGQVLDEQMLQGIVRATGRAGTVYVGPDWVQGTQEESVPAESKHAWIVETLLKQNQIRSWEERRRYKRYEWKTEMTVALEEDSGMNLVQRSVRVTTKDISVLGMGFFYDQFLNPGTIVRACFEQVPGRPILAGVVRNCFLVHGMRHRVCVEFLLED